MNAVWVDARRGHPGMFWFAVAMIGLSVALVVGTLVDQRTVLGEPVWIKPLKFTISLGLYSAALAWMLGQLEGQVLRRAGWAIVITSAIEIVIITGQAARLERSHFNVEQPVDRLLFWLMGATVVVLWLATLSIALRFLRESGRDPATATAIRLGLLVALLGAAVGFIMSTINSHAIGVPDGGPGLPFVGWSTTGGDLRVAHFVGLHALQILPLLAAALAATRLGAAARTGIVTASATAYGAVVVLLTWQALRGQPLLAPDPLTLATLAVIVLGTAGAALVAVRREHAPR